MCREKNSKKNAPVFSTKLVPSTMLLRIWVGLLVLLPFAGGCTLIAVGKHATKDGSIFVSHTDDAGDGATDLRLVNVPAADHDANATRPVYMFQFGYPRLLAAERSPLYQPKMGEQAFTPIGYWASCVPLPPFIDTRATVWV